MIRTDASALYVQPEGELTIYRAEELTKELRAALDGVSVVVVDLTETEKIDTAGFQLIAALQKSCAASGKKFELAGVCGAVQDFMALYGYASTKERRDDGV
jgi:anti-anti-sigma factor